VRELTRAALGALEIAFRWMPAAGSVISRT